MGWRMAWEILVPHLSLMSLYKTTAIVKAVKTISARDPWKLWMIAKPKYTKYAVSKDIIQNSLSASAFLLIQFAMWCCIWDTSPSIWCSVFSNRFPFSAQLTVSRSTVKSGIFVNSVSELISRNTQVAMVTYLLTSQSLTKIQISGILLWNKNQSDKPTDYLMIYFI